VVAERTVNNNHRVVIAKAFIRSDNANMSKKQCEDHCSRPKVSNHRIIRIGLYSP